ncbi:MAG: hypothetical protein RDV41_13375 [Planctomycetota bacterium]|nr:hypothetical protein [Planctomycetota bacterium]
MLSASAPISRSGFPGRLTGRGRRAFTLVELLVATGVFMLLGMLLVGLLAGGLEIWDRGEVQREMNERAFAVLELLACDLHDVYVEPSFLPYPAWVSSDSTLTAQEKKTVAGVGSDFLVSLPFMRCGTDQLGRQWLCFIKMGREDNKAAADIADRRFPLGSAANNLVYVLYILDPDPTSTRIYRGVFPLVDGTASFQSAEMIMQSRDFVRKECVGLVDRMLHFEVRFWTQHTDTWDTTYPPKVRKNKEEKIGPELRWDSTRRIDSSFVLYESDPGLPRSGTRQVVPDMVQILLVLGVETKGRTVVLLADDVDATTKRMPVDTMRGFPPAPGFARVDNEWMLFSSVASGTLEIKERGARGTVKAKHKRATPVLFGTEFRLVVRIPECRESK